MKIHPDDWRQLLGDIEQLRKDSYEANEISLKYEDRYFVALVERDEARRERDEARREVCYCHPESAQFAINRGWDCFKEEEMACDTLSQEVSQEGSKLPTTISSNGICITEYIPPQNSVREIPPYGAYTTGECTLSIKKTQ
jgi:hypothetical protein